MLRYLFCAVPSGSPTDLSSWRGEGAPLELVPVDGVAGVVGSVTMQRYGARALGKALSDVREMAPYALAHQAVVQYVFEHAPAVVPLAFGSVHRSKADAARVLEREAPRLARLLRRLEGMEEWGLRVARAPRGGEPLPRADRPGAGGAYLRSRSAALRSRELDPAARRLAERLATRMRRAATASRLGGAQGDLVLRAAYLVPRRRAPSLRKALLAASADLEAKGLVAELSGPWPPYSFTGR